MWIDLSTFAHTTNTADFFGSQIRPWLLGVLHRRQGTPDRLLLRCSLSVHVARRRSFTNFASVGDSAMCSPFVFGAVLMPLACIKGIIAMLSLQIEYFGSKQILLFRAKHEMKCLLGAQIWSGIMPLVSVTFQEQINKWSKIMKDMVMVQWTVLFSGCGSIWLCTTWWIVLSSVLHGNCIIPGTPWYLIRHGSRLDNERAWFVKGAVKQSFPKFWTICLFKILVLHYITDVHSFNRPHSFTSTKKLISVFRGATHRVLLWCLERISDCCV